MECQAMALRLRLYSPDWWAHQKKKNRRFVTAQCHTVLPLSATYQHTEITELCLFDANVGILFAASPVVELIELLDACAALSTRALQVLLIVDRPNCRFYRGLAVAIIFLIDSHTVAWHLVLGGDSSSTDVSLVLQP